MAPLVPDAVALMTIGAAGPGGSDGIVQTTVSALMVQVQPLPDAAGEVTPKRLFVTRTFCALFGPLFTTLRVNASGAPALTGFGLADAVRARSAASVTATVTLPDAVQEPLVMVRLSVALGPLPAVQTIDGVPLPLVIVPPEIDQAYVEPFCAAATEAVLPVELLATEEGARIVALEMPEEMVMVFDADAVQPEAFVTVTL